MKFSVITPSMNAFPGIKQCVGAVRSQVSKKTQVEHLIQDGGSADDTVKFCSEYTEASRQDEFYEFLAQSEKDDGMYDAINKGWKRSAGDVLSWLNHDEQYLPGTLSKVADYLEKHPDVDFVYGNVIFVASNGDPISVQREIPLRAFYLKRDIPYAVSCTVFFRRSLFERGLLKFDTKYLYAGDMDLELKLLSNGAKAGHIDEYLSLFGVDKRNLSVVHGEKMMKEVHEIRKYYGGSNNFFACKFAKGLRCTERLLNGCYKRKDVTYCYVLNEGGDSRNVTEKKAKTRLCLNKVEGKND